MYEMRIKYGAEDGVVQMILGRILEVKGTLVAKMISADWYCPDFSRQNCQHYNY